MSDTMPPAGQSSPGPSLGPRARTRLDDYLPPLLAVIAGMVDLTGFFLLGNVFTAHITGNLVLLAATAVRGGPLNLSQALSVPTFIVAVAVAWLIARVSGRTGTGLARLLLLLQFLLLTAVLIFSVVTRPSTAPHGLMAGIAVMLAVAAIAFQYALFRLAIPGAVSTAVMTGNLTNTVLSLMDAASGGHPLMAVDSGRLKRSLLLLFGFLLGCVVATAAISQLGEWAWAFPTGMAAVAMILLGFA